MSVQRARILRQNMTEAERRLWLQFRLREHFGCRFRRQHPIGPYIVDFICTAKKLVIELDGSQHLEQDANRDACLQLKGYTVLRSWNAKIFNELDSVLADIYEHLGDG